MLILALLVSPALAQTQTRPATPAKEKSSPEPEHIKVQHILIGFQGSVRGKDITRTKEEAKKLAYKILNRAVLGLRLHHDRSANRPSPDGAAQLRRIR